MLKKLTLIKTQGLEYRAQYQSELHYWALQISSLYHAGVCSPPEGIEELLSARAH